MQQKQESDYEFLYKIVLVGESGVGKTHLLSRYIAGKLPSNPTATIGVEFATRTVTLPNRRVVKAQIWDTAGQERYRAITVSHYRRAVGALLVYDVTNESTFLAAKRWLSELKEHADPNVVIMLVGNKIDICDRNPAARHVTKQQGAQFAQEHGLLFEESSAITVARVKEAFEGLLQNINAVSLRKDSTATQLHEVTSQGRNCCFNS